MTTTIKRNTLRVKLDIPAQRISDLIITACEGGINYWGDVRVYNLQGKSMYGFPELGTVIDGDDGIVGHCKLIFTEKETGDEHPLNLDVWQGLGEHHLHEKVGKAFSLMLEKCPQHLANFISENDDAEMADVFIQLALFGEIRYG